MFILLHTISYLLGNAMYWFFRTATKPMPAELQWTADYATIFWENDMSASFAASTAMLDYYGWNIK
jgi:hypothetical protein